LAILLAACAGLADNGSGAIRSIESDSRLEHAVLILENPHAFPIAVRLTRQGLARSFVVPPRSSVRQLVPAGSLQVLFGSERIALNLKPKTRVTCSLLPAGAN
jgi:hypothetical protein